MHRLADMVNTASHITPKMYFAPLLDVEFTKFRVSTILWFWVYWTQALLFIVFSPSQKMQNTHQQTIKRQKKRVQIKTFLVEEEKEFWKKFLMSNFPTWSWFRTMLWRISETWRRIRACWWTTAVHPGREGYKGASHTPEREMLLEQLALNIYELKKTYCLLMCPSNSWSQMSNKGFSRNLVKGGLYPVFWASRGLVMAFGGVFAVNS